jgi:PQQ-dependent dehydrogenase (methanol/ethanol family)
MRRRLVPLVSAAVAAGIVACATGGGPRRAAEDVDALRERIRASTGAIDDARLLAAGDDEANWLTHGRTYAEQRWSPLAQITEGNAASLGLAWSIDLGTNRGVEATPIAVDGVLFATGTWSVVYAIDARSGKLLWTHDPLVPRRYGRIACCDVVNRGVAVYKGKVYSGTLDGRLLALDAATGEKVWEVLTVDPERSYTITGAPRIVRGRVLIGNGGAELGVRGYVSAYDAETGSLAWRFYTVPGDPSKPFESKALAMAARTWHGEWWKAGGGGTVWDSMAYDPALGLVYVGVGNGSPWSRAHRSKGKGDNLFLSSIVALRADTGEYVWHFQTTPGDNWDYTATQHMILAELEIGGRIRKVLMQAPKNGFFYVIDRETGEFLSANNYAEITWATGVHPTTGRPYESTLADYDGQMRMVSPSPLGGHNWQPMAFDPKTRLVFFPVQELPGAYTLAKDFRYRPRSWNTGTGFEANLDVPDGWSEVVKGRLVAWDPVKQREAWRAEYKSAWNGGTLATAGNLVFEGTADGRFVAYRASDGELLWQSPAGTGVVAAPITYLVDGEQYVTVMAGWGGAFPLAYGEAAERAGVTSVGRVLTWKLGGVATLPPSEPFDASPPPPAPIEVKATAKERKRGGLLYHEWCAVCHGLKAVSGGVVPDLRRASAETHASFAEIVIGGVRQEKGMPSFADVLSTDDVRLIQAYVVQRVREAQPRAQAQ